MFKMSLRAFNLSLIEQYKSEPYNKDFERSMMQTLFENKNYEMIMICLENKFEITEVIMHNMLRSLYKPFYEYLFPERWTPTDLIIYKIVGVKESENIPGVISKLEIIKWLYNFPTVEPPDVLILERACRNGNIEILDYLYSMSVVKYDTTFGHFYIGAIEGGHSHVLSWIQNKWPESASRLSYIFVIKAIRNQSLPCLKWLIENGCPYNLNELITEAISQPEILEYIQTLVPP